MKCGASTVLGSIGLRRAPAQQPRVLQDRANLPAPRNLPQLRVLEGIREEVGEGLGQAGVAAVGRGVDGVEVHEP